MQNVTPRQPFNASTAGSIGNPPRGSGEACSATVRSIVCSCVDLPDSIKNAPTMCLTTRVLDRALFDSLTLPTDEDNAGVDGVRLAKRRRALADHVGRTLTCAYGHLPGMHYTIEIDLQSTLIVHWEWQST